MAEWLNAPVLKTGKGESLSRVRIPPSRPGGRSSVVELFVANEVVVSSNLIARSNLCPGGGMVDTLVLGTSASQRESSNLS